MEHLGTDDLSDVLDTVRTVGLAASPDEFLQSTLKGVVKLVPCTVATINEIDTSTDRVAFWMEPSSFPVVDGATELLAQLTAEHPLIRYVTETDDGSARRISDFWSQEQFHESQLYNLLYQPMGIEFQMSITLPAPRPTLLGLVVSRADTDFSERDRIVLNLVRPYLAQAWRNARDQEHLKSIINATKDAMVSGGTGVIILSNPPEEITPGALVKLYRYFGRPSTTSPLPARVERWVATQDAWSQAPADLRLGRPLSAKLGESQMALRYLPGNSLHPGALMLSPERREASRQSYESLGLSVREAEIVRLVTTGKSNAAIAQLLHVSPSTVKKHLDNIYAKLGTRGRGQLTAFVLNITSATG